MGTRICFVAEDTTHSTRSSSEPREHATCARLGIHLLRRTKSNCQLISTATGFAFALLRRPTATGFAFALAPWAAWAWAAWASKASAAFLRRPIETGFAFAPH